MKRVALVLVSAAVMGLFAGLAMGAEETKPAALHGTVVKVEGTNVVVKTAKAEATVATDEKTVVTIDGQKATVAELKAGMRVTVIPAEGTATKIRAMSAPKAEPKTKK
jgi:hypothetical protein